MICLDNNENKNSGITFSRDDVQEFTTRGLKVYIHKTLFTVIKSLDLQPKKKTDSITVKLELESARTHYLFE